MDDPVPMLMAWPFVTSFNAAAGGPLRRLPTARLLNSIADSFGAGRGRASTVVSALSRGTGFCWIGRDMNTQDAPAAWLEKAGDAPIPIQGSCALGRAPSQRSRPRGREGLATDACSDPKPASGLAAPAEAVIPSRVGFLDRRFFPEGGVAALGP